MGDQPKRNPVQLGHDERRGKPASGTSRGTLTESGAARDVCSVPIDTRRPVRDEIPPPPPKPEPEKAED